MFMAVRSCLRHVLNILNRKKLARRKITFYFLLFHSIKFQNILLLEAVHDSRHDAALPHDALHGPGQVALLRSLLYCYWIHQEVSASILEKIEAKGIF